MDVPLSARFPTFLDKEEALTKLIVIDCHERVKHKGVNSTLTELRSSYMYWLVQGRQLVKKLLHNCVVCRIFQCKPYKAPPAVAQPEGEGGTAIFVHRD